MFFEEFPVTVVRKRIKNMYLRIAGRNLEVRVSAPVGMPDSVIREFVLSRMDWIRERKNLLAEKTAALWQNYCQGDCYSLWGKKYKLKLNHSPLEKKVSITGDFITLHLDEKAPLSCRKKILDEFLRTELLEKLRELAPRCEELVGVSAGEYKIRDMKTRWGSCNIVDKRICLNLRLSAKPVECLKYVIIHELLHLVVANHGKKFHDCMDKLYPGWRCLKKIWL